MKNPTFIKNQYITGGGEGGGLPKKGRLGSLQIQEGAWQKRGSDVFEVDTPMHTMMPYDNSIHTVHTNLLKAFYISNTFQRFGIIFIKLCAPLLLCLL